MADRLLTGAIAAPLAQMTGSDGGMGWGIAMMVAMPLVVVLVVVGVIWLVRSLLRERAGRDRDDSGRRMRCGSSNAASPRARSRSTSIASAARSSSEGDSRCRRSTR